MAVIATLLFSSSFEKATPAAPSIPHFDKIAHFCVFGLLATLLFRSLKLSFRSWTRLLLAWFVALLYGSVDEWIQFYNPGREADWADWFTNGAGAILALALYRFWDSYRELLEWRIFSFLSQKEGSA
ncbi:VanZ family protein [Puniceicoccaceae bacterium K14]|nr:VanZ family protein [Puniceicoccaceae bacterium K14]